MKLSERIQALRISHNLTQKELGEKINVSTVSIGGWENDTRKPSVDAIISLSKIFNVSADFLLGISASQPDALILTHDERRLLQNFRALDIYGKKVLNAICDIEKSRMDSCLTLLKHQNNSHNLGNSSRYIPKYITPSAAGLSVPLDGADFEMIPVDDTIPHDADFAVRIQGDSMYPYIHDGDTVYIKKNTKLSNGEVGIFCIDGAMYCKQYYLDDDNKLMLLSANPSLRHTNIVIEPGKESDVRCFGKVLLNEYIQLPDYLNDK